MVVVRNTFLHHVALVIICQVLFTTVLSGAQEQPSTQTTHNDDKDNDNISSQSSSTAIDDSQEDEQEDDDDESPQAPTQRFIKNIIIHGNALVPTEAILNRLPYKIGEVFDTHKTRQLITNLYTDLKRFRNISVFGENVGNDGINLHITVEEKVPLKDVIFKGNKQITEKEIREKINFAAIPAIDTEELKKYIIALQKLYREKGYHNVDITAELQLDEQHKGIAVFTITEHARAVVKKITFRGNNHISGKKLRNVLFSREDWVLSFMDKAGIFQPERIEADRNMIEQFYQNNGFINAKVVDTEIVIDPQTQYVTIIHEIKEGDQYKISSVKASGNDIYKDEFLSTTLPIKPGHIYSREGIVNSIKTLEFLWGDLGYIYAHIEPSIQPDEENKTVSISFYSEIGNPVFLHRLNIIGNRKTRDKIIRRKISLEEGNLLTRRHMEGSKDRIQSLGFFDQRDGVNWKMTRLSADTADLDLVVKEIKTGSAHIQLNFGGTTINSPANGVTVEGAISDTNLFGSGIRFNLTTRVGAEEKMLLFNLTQPWLFDKPIYGALDGYLKRVGYDELRLTRPVNEKHAGGTATIGLVTSMRHAIFSDTFARFTFGVDDIRYEQQPRAAISGLITPADTAAANAAYDVILAKEFAQGTYGSFNVSVGKDAKNHPMHPSAGYSWLSRLQVTYPSFKGCIGFSKIDFDGHWFTPLIGDFDLILHIRTYMGFVNPLRNKCIPYRELFHIGGQASVRGFLYGQIGPQFAVISNGQQVQDSIGGAKTFFINTELIFPITPDFSMKGLLFYDGGAGWDNPYSSDVPARFIRNNSFNYRHAVGVGVRLLNPMPIRVDWGFKLDARKNESPSEVHFSMSYDW
jgi:outer membrane protein insertion porin family